MRSPDGWALRAAYDELDSPWSSDLARRLGMSEVPLDLCTVGRHMRELRGHGSARMTRRCLDGASCFVGLPDEPDPGLVGDPAYDLLAFGALLWGRRTEADGAWVRRAGREGVA